MGSSDKSENSGEIPRQTGRTQPLVRRLQISPPAEPDSTESGSIIQKRLSDSTPATNTISQTRAAANLKNKPISRRLSKLSLGRPVQSNAEKPDISQAGHGTKERTAAVVPNEDLVNLLLRPDARPATKRTPWYMLPLLPFQLFGEWVKHILWLSARPSLWPYPRVSPKKILNSETVQLAIKKVCEREAARGLTREPEVEGRPEVVTKNARSSHIRRARRMFDTMAANTSVTILRIASIIVNRIFRSCLYGIYVRRDQLAELKAFTLSNPGIPVVYLPLHRSHLDYILITYVLWLHNMRVPQVAAGDNMAIPVFNYLGRGLGGFFIRRRIDHDESIKRQTNITVPVGKDYIYRGVLQEYVCELLAMGHNMEFYMEGGRSRNGRTLPAKAGLLSVLLHAFQTKAVKDVIIVPGAITYDKLFDGNFAAEQRGEPKKKETFCGAVRSVWRILWTPFGSVRVEFAKPFTLKEFLQQNVKEFELDSEFDFGERITESEMTEEGVPRNSYSGSSLVDATPADQQKVSKLTQCLATRVLCASTSAQALSGPNLVAYLMMTRFRSGCSEAELVAALSELCSLLISRPRLRPLTLTDFSPTSLHHIIRYSKWLFPRLFILRTPTSKTGDSKGLKYTKSKLFSKKSPDGHIFCAHANPPNVAFELQYIANPVVEALLGEAVLATALLAVKAEQNSYDTRRKRATEVYVRVGIAEDETNDAETYPLTWSSVERVAAELCDILEMEFVYLQETQEALALMEDAKTHLVKEGLLLPGDKTNLPSIRCDPDSLQRFANLRSGIAHIIEGYYTVAVLLKGLQSSLSRHCDRCLADECLKQVISKCEKGLIEFPESCSKDIVQNAVKLFVRWGVLVPVSSPLPTPKSVIPRKAEVKLNFYLGEPSSVDDFELPVSPKAEELTSELCLAKRCLPTTAGPAGKRVKVADAWLENLDSLVVRLERYRTPPECL